jgi:hypothetical protein
MKHDNGAPPFFNRAEASLAPYAKLARPIIWLSTTDEAILPPQSILEEQPSKGLALWRRPIV